MTLPILYSFRRCPYAMRARLAIASAGITVEHREVLLRDKPPAMLDVSPKGTVPVLITDEGVIDESLDIMLWSLNKNDPEHWLDTPVLGHDLIKIADGSFKSSLDKYKYASRHAEGEGATNRQEASTFLVQLDEQLAATPFLFGKHPTLPDMAIATFVRQFAHVDLEWFSTQPWANLSRWLNQFKTSERFLNIMQKHPIWSPPV